MNPLLPKRRPPEGIQAVQKESARRLLALKLFFALFFLTICARLVKIQILEADRFQAMARKQYEQKITLPGIRGKIYDRHGNVLVSNTMYVSFAADPKIVGENMTLVAEKFAHAFGKPKSVYLERLAQAEKLQRRFVWLERQVRPELARRLDAGSLVGIVVVNEPKRLYHYDELGAATIGFTDVDGRGISGVELALEEHLRGRDGYVIMQRDGLGRARPSADYPRTEPINGQNVVLTLDLAYQSIAEDELRQGVEANKADAGLVIMLDPRTGEVLALAHYPPFNPNEPDRADISRAKNRAVSDIFEPGSIFKIITASAAYEYNLISPQQQFNAEGGTYRVPLPRGGVRFIKDTHEYTWLTFQEAIEVSSNIVMAKASTSIGAERMYRQARDFGFGILTGIDLPGEVRGRLKKPNEWSGTTLQTLSYGYEVAVTPLQIAVAYAAIANKGVLMKPYVVKEILSQDGESLRRQQPQMIRRVVNEATAALLTGALEGVVLRGTGKEAGIPSVRVAGKTGTSRKVVEGQYAEGNYTSSFIGFFPVENPQIVCLVMMDNPRARGYYGGTTSAPVFRNIARRIVNTSSNFSRESETKLAEEHRPGITVPDVRSLQLTIAQKILQGFGLKTRTFGGGNVVVKQSPEPGKLIEQGDVVILALSDQHGAPNVGITVPDVRGMSIRRAINRLMIDELDAEIVGSGVVVQQSPAAGTTMRPGGRVRLVCEPRTLQQVALY
jgi:cell division protein FtsI/penicillin-binding protein 2